MSGGESFPLPARWLIFHIASGQAFFSGFALLAAAVGLSLLIRTRAGRICRNALLIVGAALVGLSSTPLPGWCHVVAVAGFTPWIVGQFWPRRVSRRIESSLAAAAITATTVAVATEIPHHVLRPIAPLGRPTLGIIGDSLTEGMGTSTIITWPRLLADAHQIRIRDHARMGATVASALGQAEKVGPDEDLVLLEIGGNDILGTTTPGEFEAGLARLLSALRRPRRTLVMLELPLPPGSARYGEIQRRLAREYDVMLVPKRFLIGILQAPGATLDTVHLSQNGHRLMAEGIWGILAAAYRPSGPQ